MVKKLSGLMAIAVLSMGLLTATNINSTSEFYSDDLVESTKDFMKNPGVKYLNDTVFNTNEAVEYSKTYTQYGLDSEGRYCLRFATAVKGNIETLSYTRGKVASLNKEEVTKPVDVIYNGIKSGEEISYYDGTDLTTDSQYAGNYYWACYTICFTDKALYDTDVTVNLNIKWNSFTIKNWKSCVFNISG